MLSYKIIILYIEWYLHYTLDYYIKHEYNIYIQISFSFGAPKDKFQVTSLLRFCPPFILCHVIVVARIGIIMGC